jgi:hypothetical protein
MFCINPTLTTELKCTKLTCLVRAPLTAPQGIYFVLLRKENWEKDFQQFPTELNEILPAADLSPSLLKTWQELPRISLTFSFSRSLI